MKNIKKVSSKTEFKRIAAFAAAIALLAMTGCSESSSASSSVTASNIDNKISAEDMDVGYDESEAATITFSDTDVQLSGSGVEANGTDITITSAGTYILSGSCSDGRIIVDAGKKAEVRLVFNGLDLTCKDNAPILVTKADKVYITMEDNTENVISDSGEYELSEDENTDAAIFSKADLTINGEGSLTVNANYKHGVVSKDDLVITGGNITVTSVSTAIEGKDSVKISGGTFNISAGTNGIRSTNTEDTEKGFISISGGTFNITANGDGIEAETVLSVDGGEFNITTGGGSANASMKSDGTPNGDWQNDMGGDPPTPPDGTNGGAPDMQQTDNTTELNVETLSASSQDQTSDTDSESTSAKGLKTEGNLEITAGTFNIDSADDSFHCGGDMIISGGTLNAASGDDGMHSDNNLSISDGEITISKSYEGIEGLTVTISGGNIDVTSSDDGVNCAGGSDTSSDDRMGRDQFAAQEGVYLSITGGTLNVDAGGDGLDSNGDFYMEGGTVYISGPTNGGNGALDYNGEATIKGGTIIASGAVGMEECFGENSTQYAVLHDFSQTLSAGTEFTVKDSSGNVILSYTNNKTWQGIVFSSPDLKEGETYTVTAGDMSEEITISDIITSNSTGSGFGGGMGDMGGGRRF